MGEKMYSRYLSNFFIAEKFDEDYCLILQNGHLLDSKTSKKVALSILQFLEKYSQKDIDEYNENLERKKYEEIMSFSKQNSCKKTKKPKMIYLFECNGKYKIGITSNIKQRLKQLNNRPFPVILISNSKLVNNALELEQNLHEKYEKQKIDGEWFELNSEQIKDIICFLSELGGV